MKLFVVALDRDGKVVVIEAPVMKETAQFYFIQAPEGRERYAFGYSTRIPKGNFAQTPEDALQRYITRRTMDWANAQAVIDQAIGQIADAKTVLAKFEAQAVGA